MNLKREINLNRKFIIMMIFLNVIALGLYYSYALFETKVIKDNVVVIKTLSIDVTTNITGDGNTFVIPKGSKKTITGTISTAYNDTIGYKIYYTSVSNNDDIVVNLSNIRTSGEMTNSLSFEMTLENLGSIDETITIGTIGGLKQYEINLENGYELNYRGYKILELMKPLVVGHEGVYYFDANGDLDYGDGTKIELNLARAIPKGNVSIWNNQVIYACFNYGNDNYEYSYNATLKKRELTSRSMPCLTDRYQNLVINGDLSYGSNYNLEQFGEYNQDGYLQLTTNYSTVTSLTDYIPIDLNKKYLFSIDIRSSNEESKYYVGYSMYDPDKKDIDQFNVSYFDNTLTEFTRDLNPGDRVVYLKDLSNWNSNATSSNSFVIWNMVDSTGYIYQPLTYGTAATSLYSNNNQLDKTNNTISLNDAWQDWRGKIPKGTLISQARGLCGQYHYSLIAYKTLTNEFETYSSVVNNTTNSICDKFRNGTKFIKFVIYYNSNSNNIPNTTTDIKNIYIREVQE